MSRHRRNEGLRGLLLATVGSSLLHPGGALLYEAVTPEPPPKLYVAVTGEGGGAVVSTPAGIDCGDQCTATFERGSAIELQAIAGEGSTFAGWPEHCEVGDRALSCRLTLEDSTRVEVEFGRVPDRVEVSWAQVPQDQPAEKSAPLEVTLPDPTKKDRQKTPPPEPENQPEPPEPEKEPPELAVTPPKPEPVPKPEPEKKPQEPKPEKNKKPQPPNMKAVEVPDENVVEEAPDDAQFLSDKNRDVAKQTHARDTNLERQSDGEQTHSEKSDIQSDQVGAPEEDIAQLENTDPSSLDAERLAESRHSGEAERATGVRRGVGGDAGDRGGGGDGSKSDEPGALSMRGIQGEGVPGGPVVDQQESPRQGKPGRGGERGKPGDPGKPGVQTRLSFDDYKRIVGEDKAKEERELARRRMSKKRGRWERKRAALKASLENFTPEVQPGNQTALKTRAAPFAVYIARVHRRIHELWGFGFLAELSDKPASHELNNWKLRTKLEIVLNSDGTVDKTTIVEPSGTLTFDVAAIDVVRTAAPFKPPPEKIRSANGKVYIHWYFNRDWRQCGTFGAHPFILDNPPADTDQGSQGGPMGPLPQRGGSASGRTPGSGASGRGGPPRQNQPAAAARAATTVPAPDDPNAERAAKRWLSAFTSGQSQRMAAVSAAPFRSGGSVVANGRSGIASVYQTVIREADSRQIQDWAMLSAAGYRQRFGALPPGISGPATKLFLVVRIPNERFTLVLARQNDGDYAAVGFER